MEQIRNPILYVPEARTTIKKMLVSVGGLMYAESAESLAIQIGKVNNAEISILHVIVPSDLNYPTMSDARSHLDNLAESDTLPGRTLKKALDFAQEAGLNAKVLTRQGNVVEEILSELKKGSYDMACMGSPYSASSLRQMYTPNVTAEVAEVAHCPVLTARYKPV